jgi:CcmD family protein
MKYFILNQIQQKSNEMPDAAGTEKFMVVIAVVAVLFLGIAGYLVSLDLKLKKLEKN